MDNSSFLQSQAALEHSKLVSKIKLMQPGVVLDTNLIVGRHMGGTSGLSHSLLLGRLEGGGDNNRQGKGRKQVRLELHQPWRKAEYLLFSLQTNPM